MLAIIYFEALMLDVNLSCRCDCV